MFERLEQIELKYEELNKALASPDIVSDSQRYQKTAKAHSEVAPIVEKYREYKDLTRGIDESKGLLEGETDPEMLAYAHDELAQLEKRVAEVEEELKVLLLPKDPNDEKNVILEIRAGTGGDEATLFAAEIFRMYTRYAEKQRWKVEVLSTLRVRRRRPQGSDRHHRRPARVFAAEVRERRASRAARPADGNPGPRSHFGGHRRGAAGSGRSRHQDRSQGHSHRYVLLVGSGRTVGEHDLLGGAHHAPADQHGRQLPGREIADQESRKGHARAARAPVRNGAAEAGRTRLAKERKQQVGSGDRSEKIRTYNFPQNRVTDHRIGLTLHQLPEFMEGKLQPIVDALITHYQAEQLKAESVTVA